MVQTSSITVPSMVGSGLKASRGGGKKVQYFVVCFCQLRFCSFLNSIFCANYFAIKAFEYGNGFDHWIGESCSCVHAFNFISVLLDGTTTEC